MMKKMIALMMIAAMLLTAVAFAEEYRCERIAFTYDENFFEISYDDVGENDDHLVVLSSKNEEQDNAYIRFYTYMQAEGEQIPTAESVQELYPDAEVTQGEWNGFYDVVMFDNGDEFTYLVPLTTGEVLTVGVGVTEIEDEDVAAYRDDMISAVLDTLEIIPEIAG